MFLVIIVNNFCVQSICLVVKHTVSTLMEDSLVFLPQIAEVITTGSMYAVVKVNRVTDVFFCVCVILIFSCKAHRLSPQTATLDVAKLVTMMYSQATGEVNNLIRVFLSEIIGTTLNVIRLIRLFFSSFGHKLHV